MKLNLCALYYLSTENQEGLNVATLSHGYNRLAVHHKNKNVIVYVLLKIDNHSCSNSNQRQTICHIYLILLN